MLIFIVLMVLCAPFIGRIIGLAVGAVIGAAIIAGAVVWMFVRAFGLDRWISGAARR